MFDAGRIGQNFQNEVLMERSIVPEFVAYQLNHLNRNLRGVRKYIICIVPYGTKLARSIGKGLTAPIRHALLIPSRNIA